MQGTVSAYDPRTRTGSVLLDSGAELAFGADAFDASGLRLLRAGQRVRLRTTDSDGTAKITALQILTLPD